MGPFIGRIRVSTGNCEAGHTHKPVAALIPGRPEPPPAGEDETDEYAADGLLVVHIVYLGPVSREVSLDAAFANGRHGDVRALPDAFEPGDFRPNPPSRAQTGPWAWRGEGQRCATLGVVRGRDAKEVRSGPLRKQIRSPQSYRDGGLKFLTPASPISSRELLTLTPFSDVFADFRSLPSLDPASSVFLLAPKLTMKGTGTDKRLI